MRPVSAVEPLGRGVAGLLISFEATPLGPTCGASDGSLYAPLDPFGLPHFASRNTASALLPAADKPEGEVSYGMGKFSGLVEQAERPDKDDDWFYRTLTGSLVTNRRRRLRTAMPVAA